MTAATSGYVDPVNRDQEISILILGSILLRWRRKILLLAAIGALLGIAIALTAPRLYVSSATFLPQGSETANSGLAAAASQFGFRVPTQSTVWGAPVYVKLLGSRALLEPIALDTVTIAEEGGRRVPMMDLLGVSANRPALRVERAVRALGRIVTSREVKSLGAVEVTVTTKWPSVSHAVAQKLVSAVNQFNVETRRSQAAAEAQFAGTLVAEAERALRDAEDRFQAFLQRNRAVGGSPELAFDRDRLQRAVVLRQQLYTSLLQNREDARIRQVRDTPVITVLESPRLPTLPQGRGTALKAILGGLSGAMIGIVAALLAHALSEARRTKGEEAHEFFQLVEEAKPKFLRRTAP